MPEFADSVLRLMDDLDLRGPRGRYRLEYGRTGRDGTWAAGPRPNRRVCAGCDNARTCDASGERPTPRNRRSSRARRDVGTGIDIASRLFGLAARRNSDLVDAIFSMMLHTPPAGAAAALRGRAERPDYSTLLNRLRVPALVIAGDHDGYADEAVVAQLLWGPAGPKGSSAARHRTSTESREPGRLPASATQRR